MEETKKRATLRDAAARAGVSVSTAHLVLSGKPGPKEETRKRVMEACEELGYQCNSVASSLKRGVTKIAVILPALTKDNRYYYTPVWDGVRAFCQDAKDFNIELVEIPYENPDLVAVPIQAVERMQQEDKVMGLIALGKIAPDATDSLRAMSDKGLPIVLINGDVPETGRLCCVQANNYMQGAIMGEIFYRQTPRGGSVLVCAGDEKISANLESVQGLEDYFSQHDEGRTIHRIYHGNDMEQLYRHLMERLENCSDITCCCSVTARGSIQLGRALSDTGKAPAMPAIGSDLFRQNFEYLKSGVFTNLIFKNPFQQGWIAAETLFNSLLRGQQPERDTILVKGEVIFQSSTQFMGDSEANGQLYR